MFRLSLPRRRRERPQSLTALCECATCRKMFPCIAVQFLDVLYSSFLFFRTTTATEGDCAVEPLATPQEVADFLRQAPKTLAQWRSQGIGPSYLQLANGNVRYRSPVVREWLDAQAV